MDCFANNTAAVSIQATDLDMSEWDNFPASDWSVSFETLLRLVDSLDTITRTTQSPSDFLILNVKIFISQQRATKVGSIRHTRAFHVKCTHVHVHNSFMVRLHICTVDLEYEFAILHESLKDLISVHIIYHTSRYASWIVRSALI